MNDSESTRERLSRIFTEQLEAMPDEQVLAIDDPAEFADRLMNLLVRGTRSAGAAPPTGET
ncbi:hypothetical protein [Paeniglutamicibacter sp.]|uniref:hypothetical protein n=1 Tax=Paeniglutamicibacter sp. TaxID=1934391 RepID=UPI003989F15E